MLRSPFTIYERLPAQCQHVSLLLHKKPSSYACFHAQHAAAKGLSQLHVSDLVQGPPIPLTRECVVPPAAAIEQSLVPPSFPSLPLAASNDLPQASPAVQGDICNFGMPADSTLDRYIWVIQQFVEQVCTVQCARVCVVWTGGVKRGGRNMCVVRRGSVIHAWCKRGQAEQSREEGAFRALFS